MELSNIFTRVVKVEYFAEGAEKCKILGKFLDREVEILDDRGRPKVQGLVDEEFWICSSYPFRHKTTLRCAECKANMFRNWILRDLMF